MQNESNSDNQRESDDWRIRSREKRIKQSKSPMVSTEIPIASGRRRSRRSNGFRHPVIMQSLDIRFLQFEL